MDTITTTELRCNLDKASLAHHKAIVDKNNYRYVGLRSILIDAGEQRTVTSNGKSMLVVPFPDKQSNVDPDELHGTALLDIETASAAVKAMPKGKTAELRLDKCRIKIQANGTTIDVAEPQGQFPASYRACIPADTDDWAVRVKLDADTLSKLIVAISRIGKDRGNKYANSVELCIPKPDDRSGSVDKPVRVNGSGGVVGVIMPCAVRSK